MVLVLMFFGDLQLSNMGQLFGGLVGLFISYGDIVMLQGYGSYIRVIASIWWGWQGNTTRGQYAVSGRI